MIKESNIYTTTDGKEYKSKKAAERHQNELLVIAEGLEKKDVDFWVDKLSKVNSTIKTLLTVKPDWRNWATFQVKQLVQMVKEAKEDIVQYVLVEERWMGKIVVLDRIKTKRILDKLPPKEFRDKVEELSKNFNDGTKIELVLKEDLPFLIEYKIVKTTLSIEEKLKKGFELSSEEIEELVFDFPEKYEEKGEPGRWSQPILTVVEVENLGLYAIEWDNGLTEMQENEFYNQPKKVELREKEVITTITEVIYI